MRLSVKKAHNYTAGGREVTESEPFVSGLEFKIHKFTPRKRPKAKDTVIFPIFSEFGCETLAVVYCLPYLLQRNFVGKYTIVMGWAGRAYFYKHLVDEFWEIPEDYMWLREYSRAFHHVSKNLHRYERDANEFGKVIDISALGNVLVFPFLQKCPHCDQEVTNQKCNRCNIQFPDPGFFANIPEAKKYAVWLTPSDEKKEAMKKYLPPRAVGITGRRRKTWGRNLDSIFYERLIYLIEDLGYNPVWLGEKATSLPCPLKRIIDFSDTKEANDLESTLALVSQMEFTVQFWTASTRLAAMVGTPYIIFESPDQIWSAGLGGQEGMRLNLITRGEKKIVACHYQSAYEDNTATLDLVKRAVRDIEHGDYDDIIGLVEDENYIKFMKQSQDQRIGRCQT
jgi:hypothetical protein